MFIVILIFFLCLNEDVDMLGWCKENEIFEKILGMYIIFCYVKLIEF